jgi:hypothetical protein
MKFNVEAIEFAGQQVNAIQDGCGKVVEMAKHMPPVSRAPAHMRQIFIRHAPNGVCAKQEVKGSRK